MGKPTGFKEFPRKAEAYRDATKRLLDFEEIYTAHDAKHLAVQGSRCMDCGVPFCQSTDGCPIHNLIPEWNDLVYRGHWREALDRLHQTNNFPEFTGRVCPAPCEGACVLGITDPAVTIKNIEMAIIDKGVVERRIDLLRAEGVTFHVSSPVGDGSDGSLDVKGLLSAHDAVLFATGATVARDLPIPGRELSGIHFAMDFLRANTKSLLDSKHADGNYISAKDKDVIVIGGGDTGTDCIGTSLRHGCRSLVNFEILPQPPAGRAADNPWPTWPKIFRVDYGHEEAAKRFGADPRVYSISGKSFDGKDGRLTGMRTTEVKFVGNQLQEIPNTEKVWKADLILIAMGFLGPEHNASDALGVAYDPRSNLRADYGKYATSVPKVFAAGDCRRGQSLVVRAINEGREAAREIDRTLMGETLLP